MLRVAITEAVIPSDFIITGVQLEPGPVATPFEHRPIGLELSLCQRYYQRYDNRVCAAVTNPSDGSERRYSCSRTVQMRAKPDETYTLNTGTGTESDSTASAIHLRITAASNGSQCFVSDYTADAEL